LREEKRIDRMNRIYRRVGRGGVVLPDSQAEA
jgi:hypothetical protein